MTARTELDLRKELAGAYGWVGGLSFLLALSRAADSKWFWAVLWLASAVVWGAVAVLEFREYRRRR